MPRKLTLLLNLGSGWAKDWILVMYLQATSNQHATRYVACVMNLRRHDQRGHEVEVGYILGLLSLGCKLQVLRDSEWAFVAFSPPPQRRDRPIILVRSRHTNQHDEQHNGYLAAEGDCSKKKRRAPLKFEVSPVATVKRGANPWRRIGSF